MIPRQTLILMSILAFTMLASQAIAQDIKQSPGKVYTSISAAMKNPESVVGLDLSHSSVSDLEKTLPQFINLEYLNLSDAHLTRVPNAIVKLTKLRYLDLSGNDIKYLPEDLVFVKTLEELRLDRDLKLDTEQALKIAAKLPRLTALSLRGDSLSTLPESILEMPQLRRLNIGDNPLTELPAKFAMLKTLEELYLDREVKLNFKQAFKVLGQMKNLRILHIEDNRLKVLPNDLSKISSLEELFVARNSLVKVDLDLRRMNKLNYVELFENPIKRESLDYLERTGLRFGF